MPLIVDFILPHRPVSHQTKDAVEKLHWQNFVYGRAMAAWPVKPLLNCPLKFTMVYVADLSKPGDINNFVKPVQDALCGLIYADDSMIVDVSAHLRHIGGRNDGAGLPEKLRAAFSSGAACVYVAISDSRELSEELQWI